MSNFTKQEKKNIEDDIKKDFEEGFVGIKMLPKDAKLGVYLAYIYYLRLFEKIKNLEPKEILENRIRISNIKKFFIMLISIIKVKFRLI